MIEKRKSIDTSYGKMNYLLFYPEELKENIPMVVFLHGISERGTDVNDVKRYSFPAFIQDLDVPYVCICPQCSENNFWEYHLRDVEEIINKTIDEYHCDGKRIAIMGSSMGACGAWSYMMQRPELFKCLISASGRVALPIKENIDKIIDKSFLIYHGTSDDIIDYHNSLEIYEALLEAGAKDVKLQLVEKGDHYVCSNTYKKPYVYRWLKDRL